MLQESGEVKKLPTLEDKTIDKNKKYPPMENLADAGKKSSARNGLLKLKRIRDEMFKKKHQSLKEEEENKQNQEEATPETTEIKDKTEETDGNFKTIQYNPIYVNLLLFFQPLPIILMTKKTKSTLLNRKKKTRMEQLLPILQVIPLLKHLETPQILRLPRTNANSHLHHAKIMK